jgi:hypothetical protein
VLIAAICVGTFVTFGLGYRAILIVINEHTVERDVRAGDSAALRGGSTAERVGVGGSRPAPAHVFVNADGAER